ncbi:MAG: hypothetical protein V3V49_08630 [Candidatus Krumholzibacteria bacterium]
MAISEEIARELLERLGENNVSSIFVTGSVAKGEAASYVAGESLEIYSDVDVAVVVDDAADLEACRRLARGVAAAHPRRTTAYRVFPTPDVGVFTLDDLRAQQARPGTVDIGRSHRVIFGSAQTPFEADARSNGGIAPEEALYLLEHRLLESREVVESGGVDAAGAPQARYAHYVTLKNCLDAVTALLIAVGEYAPSRDERMRLFRRGDIQGRLASLMPAGSRETIDDCEDQMRRLQSTLAAGDFTPERRQVDQLLLQLWKRIGDRIHGESGEWYEALRRRGGAGRARDNLRELMVIARRRSLSRLRVVVRSRAMARYSPLSMLRLTGVVEALVREMDDEAKDDRIEKHFLGAMDALTREFGFRDGPLFRRGRDMYRAVT